LCACADAVEPDLFATLIPAAFTTLCHFATSRRSISRRRSGVPPVGSMPLAARRSLMSGSSRMRLISLFQRATMSTGKPFGPHTAPQLTAS
jgi:hypothetical protein